MLIDRARRLWSRTGWARLGRIADALERLESRPPEPRNAVATEAPAVGIRQRMGLTLLLDPASDVDRWMIQTGSWEPEQFAKLKAIAAEALSKSSGPRVFFDIGAYFGLYALLMDRERMFDRIVAFEPDRLNFAQLQSQLFLNGAAYRIEARNVAVGEAPGIVHMQRADRHPTGNRAGAGLWGCGDVNALPVGMVAVDEEIDVSGGLIVAKIDVGSNQDAVLRGMRRTIERNACVLQIEAFEEQRAATRALLDDLNLDVVADMPPDLFAVHGISI